MRYLTLIFAFAPILMGCDRLHEIDETPPASPRGITTISLDNAVQLNWLHNTEPDLDGYRIWVSDRFDGRYELIGTTRTNEFIDRGAKNGITYYYGLTAFDFVGNESPLSKEVVYDTPRPEGFNVRLNNFRQNPNASGYDFSTYSVGPYDDDYTDVFYEYVNGRSYLNVWSDTDIQGMGYTRSLDDISVAPTSGWAPSKSVEAIAGHTYVIWTWDDHYAKIRLIEVRSSYIIFDWAYQTAKGNPELRKLGGIRVRQIRPRDEAKRY
ncbi:MAG: hypothetical protein FJ215_04465 [Ignavibacteria bacterium]|nr:hypothetical protein [Ignavibacteria bacterium]